MSTELITRADNDVSTQAMVFDAAVIAGMQRMAKQPAED